MRILYLSGSTLPSRAANSVHVMKMCSALAAIGCDVTLYGRGSRSSTEEIFKVYGIEPRFEIVLSPGKGHHASRRIRHFTMVRQVLDQLRPQLVYARYLPGLVPVRYRGTPFIWESHVRTSILQRLVERWLFRSSSFRRLVVISRSLREEYARMHPTLDASRVLVAPDAADPPAKGLGRSFLDASSGGPLRLQVGYVGSLYPGRGVEILIGLASRLPDVDFHVIGGSSEERSHWLEQARGVFNLRFHGFVEPARTDSFRAAMDILVAPYQVRVLEASGAVDTARWMSPLKIFEYMAARKAIVASDLPAIREILRNGETALLVQADHLDSWVAAVRELMDPRYRSRLSANAYQTFEANFTWRQRAQRVVDGI